jgi:serine kinase of HPr protein (carbohydrate metabolism regulator)
MNPAPALVHATAVAIDGHGILLLGASGSGKSDLAMRLIDRGATLVSDDYCDIAEIEGAPLIQAKPSIAGRIELRGVGIIPLDHLPQAPLALALQLDRLPKRLPVDTGSIDIAGWAVPGYALAPFESSAALKAEMLLHRVIDAGRRPVRLITPGYTRSKI